MYGSDKIDLTEKQIPFYEWLMATLGFIDDSLTEQFVSRLNNTSFRYRSTRRIPTSLFNTIYKKEDKLNYDRQIQELKKYGFNVMKVENDSYKDGNIEFTRDCLYQRFGESYFIPKNYKLIDYLSDELRIKQNNLIEPVKNPNKNSLSATDIANYTYCPVAYTISKTFEQEKSLSAETGTLLHEQNILKNLLFKLTKRITGIEIDANYQKTMNENITKSIVDDSNGYFFKDIATADLVKSGHNSNQEYYHNKDLNFFGMPDYVYKNKDGKHFFVEEKFMLRRDSKGVPPFYANHIDQLSSYISLISEVKAEYGYLVYWLYVFDYGEPKVQQCVVKKLERSITLDRNITNIKNSIDALKNGQTFQFIRDTNRVSKCIGCVYNRICGHKTGKYDSYQLPYNKHFLGTFNIGYSKNTQSDITSYSEFIELNDSLPF